ncbi:hypothetical protein [Acinetobacter sp. ANC 4173]|uniref:hypothetical protein n=1 Tax=Acinetobacter sp. ANC 4173 TaxID=2529837 RepID=UPI00103C5975|nr:hypothetical protein [Acinetobacter sp. ANC 4173]TCB74170.1 hypothetical protein E0H94_17690 [Acinetobacter sp. ANC 4173]
MNTIGSIISKSMLIVTATVSFETYQVLKGLLGKSYNDHGFSFYLFRVFLFEHLPVGAKFFIKTFLNKLKKSLIDSFMSVIETKFCMYLIA